MINNVKNNPFNKNPYAENNFNITDEIKKIESQLLDEISIKDLPETELIKLKKLDKSVNEEVSNFLKRIHEELKKAEFVAIKIIRGEKITKEESKFISEKYPDIKKTAEEAKKDTNNLKDKLSNCKSEEERQKLITNVVKEIKAMLNKGFISEIQSRIKMAGVEEARKSLINIKSEQKKAESIAIKIVKGEKLTLKEEVFISDKYPDLKQTSEKLATEVEKIKYQLKGCKTEKERQQLISKETNLIKDTIKNGFFSKIDIKIKVKILEEFSKEINKINKEIQKSDLIAIKIAKGEKLTKTEINFINEKYPEIKQSAEKVASEIIDLKEKLINSKNIKEKEDVISRAMESLEFKSKKGLISENGFKIALLTIEKLKKEDIYTNERDSKHKYIINPYIFTHSGSFIDKLIAIIVVIIAVGIFLKLL